MKNKICRFMQKQVYQTSDKSPYAYSWYRVINIPTIASSELNTEGRAGFLSHPIPTVNEDWTRRESLITKKRSWDLGIQNIIWLGATKKTRKRA